MTLHRNATLRAKIAPAPPFLALALAGVTGCTESPRGTGGSDPLASLPIAELVEVYRLGGADAPDEEAFQAEPGIVSDEAGLAYVRHGRRGRVAVFDPEGTFLRWIGGSGSGPGEFELAFAHGLVGDTLWVRNVPTPRISRFLTDGTHLATVQAPFDLGYPMSSPQGISGYLAGGRAFVVADGFVVGRDGPVPLPVLVGDSEMQRVDTLFPVPNPRGRLAGMAFQPFPVPPWFDVAPDGSGLVLAEWSDEAPGDVGLRVFAPDGTERARWSLAFPPEPVAASVRDSVVTAAVAEVEALAARLREAGISEGFRETISRREVEEEVYLPSHHPPVRRVLAGPEGGVWLQRAEGFTAGAWIAFDVDGSPLFQVRPPAGTTLRHVSKEAIWTVERDEMEVPYLVKWRVVAP